MVEQGNGHCCVYGRHHWLCFWLVGHRWRNIVVASVVDDSLDPTKANGGDQCGLYFCEFGSGITRVCAAAHTLGHNLSKDGRYDGSGHGC